MSSQQSTLLFEGTTPGVSRRGLRAFLKRLQAEVAGGRAFCCLISGDAELRRLNRKFRGQDYSTDVLSFPSLPVGQASGLSGQARGLPHANVAAGGSSVGEI